MNLNRTAMSSEGMNEEINHFPQFAELRQKRNAKYNIIYNKRVNYVDAVQAFVVRNFYVHVKTRLFNLRYSKRYDFGFHRISG